MPVGQGHEHAFVLVSDKRGTIARAYGSRAAGALFLAHVFVIGKDGRSRKRSFA